MKLAAPVVALVGILNIPFYISRISLFSQQYLALFWGIICALIFLSVSADRAKARESVPWYDLILAAASIVVGIYVAVYYPQILLSLGRIDTPRVVLGITAVVLTLETSRRVQGWPLIIIVSIFIGYALLGSYFPGVLNTKSVTWTRLASQLFLGADALFGIPLKMAVMVVFAYILFGQFLSHSGGAEFFMDVANSLMGRQRGGPAKAAVIASMLLGGFSSSAVGNVAAIGTVTIPAMRKYGYPAKFAAAVEAVSGTGDVIVPPIMGTAAFVMAEFVGVPYAIVAFAALMPGVLYYFGDFMQIHLRAAKMGLSKVPAEDITPIGQVLARGWRFLIPIGVLIVSLFVIFLSAELSALMATVAVILVAVFNRETWFLLKPAKILEIIRNTCSAMMEITAVCAAAGLIVGTITYTGLGFSFSVLLTDLSGGHLLTLAILTAVASIILGMGMPATPCYVLLATVVAPAMIKLGVPTILAHLFVYYFGSFSFLVPPICLAVCTACAIAKTPVIPTSFQAMRLAVTGFIVPFMFLYRPGLALTGEPGSILLAVVMSIPAVVFLASAMEGYLLSSMGWLERALLAAAGIAVFAPQVVVNLIGLAVAVPVLVLQWQRRRSVMVTNQPDRLPT